MVARIESGQRRIDVVELIVLARALQADPAEIVGCVDAATQYRRAELTGQLTLPLRRVRWIFLSGLNFSLIRRPYPLSTPVPIKSQLPASAALSAPLGCIVGRGWQGQPKPAATFKSTRAPRVRRAVLLKWRFKWNDPLRYFALLKARAGWLKIGAHNLFGEGPVKAQFEGLKITKIRGENLGFCPVSTSSQRSLPIQAGRTLGPAAAQRASFSYTRHATHCHSVFASKNSTLRRFLKVFSGIVFFLFVFSALQPLDQRGPGIFEPLAQLGPAVGPLWPRLGQHVSGWTAGRSIGFVGSRQADTAG